MNEILELLEAYLKRLQIPPASGNYELNIVIPAAIDNSYVTYSCDLRTLINITAYLHLMVFAHPQWELKTIIKDEAYILIQINS